MNDREFSRIEDVDAFCLRLYSGDKAATLKVTSEGWKRIIDEIGLCLLLTVLQQSTSVYSIIFVSRAASECLETLFADAEQLAQFTSNVYDLLKVRDAELNAAAKLALRQLVCVSVQRGYQHSAILSQMPSNLCASLSSSTATGEVDDGVRIACEVLADLVVTLSDRRMSTFATDVSIARSFRDHHLLNIFQFGVRVVKEVHLSSRASVVAGLRLVQRVLDFDFACDTLQMEAVDNPMSRTYPENWVPVLVDVHLLERLWDIYHVADLESDVARTILDVLTSLVSLRKAIFTDEALRRRWYAIVLQQTYLVMNGLRHLEDEETQRAFARLLNRIKPNCELNELLQLTGFPKWLHALCAFTKQCLEHWRHASASVLSLLSVWARLMEATSYAAHDTSEMSRCGVEIVDAYWACARSRAWAFAAGHGAIPLISDDGSTTQPMGKSGNGVDYPLDDDVEGVQLELEFVLKLVVGCGEEGWKLLEAYEAQVSQSLQTHMLLDVAALSVHHIALMEEVAWSMHLVSATLCADGAIDSGAAHVLKILGHTFAQLQLFSSQAKFCDRLPETVRGHVAAATTRLLSSVLSKTVSVYVVSNRKTSAFVEQLSSQLRQCGAMEGPITFGGYFLNVAVHVLWATLNATNVPDDVRIDVLQLLDEWTSTSSVVRLLKESCSRTYLMSLDDECIPAPLRCVASLRARYLFARCVAQLRFLDASTLTDSVLNELVSPLLARLSRAVYTAASTGPSATSNSLLALVICDVRGIMSCAERRPYRVAMDMIESSLGPLADAVLQERNCGEEAVIQLLELVNEVATNKSQRIMCGAQSAKPVLIFRYVSHVIVRATQHVCLLLENRTTPGSGQSPPAQLLEWAWRVTRLSLTAAYHLLQGGWCNVAVLQLYEDAALSALLSSVWALLSKPPTLEFMARPRVCAAVVQMVNALASRFFHAFWAAQPASEVSAVIGFVESLAFPACSAVAAATEATQQSDALQAVERLINSCWVRTAYPAEEVRQAAVMKATLLQVDALLFHRLVTCALERSVAVDNHAMRRLLLPLFHVEGTAIREVALYFCTRATSPSAARALQAQFVDIQQRVCSPDDITNRTVEGLQNALHTLLSTLKESL